MLNEAALRQLAERHARMDGILRVHSRPHMRTVFKGFLDRLRQRENHRRRRS